jgi:hypothetical protein
MGIKMKQRLLAVLIGASVLAVPAQAAVLTFEGVPDNAQTLLTFDGFQFSIARHYFHVGSGNGWASNGTTMIGVHRNDAPAAPVTMSATGGATFSLESIDLSEFYLLAGARTVTVVGTLAGGGVLNTSFALDGVADGIAGGVADFETFNFGSAWTGLSRVVFDSVMPGVADDNSWAFDNIRVNQAAAVPEPASLALFGISWPGWAPCAAAASASTTRYRPGIPDLSSPRRRGPMLSLMRQRLQFVSRPDNWPAFATSAGLSCHDGFIEPIVDHVLFVAQPVAVGIAVDPIHVGHVAQLRLAAADDLAP